MARSTLPYVLVLLLGGVATQAKAEDARFLLHRFVSADGLETAETLRRSADPTDPADLADPGWGADGWIQAEPRETFRRGAGVPLPLTPDWVGTRTRAVGALAWFDADGDGDLDLFVGTYSANSFPPIEDYYNFVYLNEGGVLEDEPTWIAAAERHTGDLAVGDIDGDQKDDIFVANGGGSLQVSEVFYGRDALIPTTPDWTTADNTWTIGIALADYDDDGDLDVATANQGRTGDPYRPTQLFENGGSGLNPVPIWSSQQIGITNAADFADFDGDGLLDLAVSGWVGWETGVFRNTESGLETTFHWTTGAPDETDKGIGWARVDADASPDLGVGGNGTGNPDRWYRNENGVIQTTPEWQSQEPFHGCQELVWVDVDTDGDMDLATVHFSTGHTRIFLNTDGVLSAAPDWQYDASSSGTAMAFGDMNGDGAVDLAIGVANGPVELFFGESDPTGVPDVLVGGREPMRVEAFPNPADRTFTLQTSSSSGSSSASRVTGLRLVDVSGRTILEYGETYLGEALALPDGIARGVYFLEGRVDEHPAPTGTVPAPAEESLKEERGARDQGDVPVRVRLVVR